MLTVTEVAVRLRVSPQTVYNKLQTGVWHGVKVGREWRISEGEVARLELKGEQRGIITHGDEIRAMNNEQLAKFLCEFRSCNSEGHPCNSCVAASNCYPGHCGMGDWVKSVVKR